MSKPLAGVRVLAHARDNRADGILSALRTAGAQVQATRDVQEAVDAFQADPPNIVIGELDETDARDHKLIRGIRALKKGRDVPAIAVSALPWEEHRAGALAAGFSQWVSEPAQESIIEAVTTLLRREAEPVARPLATAWTGRSLLTDITITPLSEIIRHLWRARRSGDLLVRTRRTNKMVFFDRGRIVFAASNVRKERLGEVLLALGTISGDEFHLTSRVMAERKVRFGDALVAAGVMDKGKVATSVVRWVERIVHSLFDISVGTAAFEDRACPIPPDYRVDIPAGRVLYQGARAMKDIERVRTALGNLDRPLAYTGNPDFAIEPEDIGILELAKAPVTIRRLAWGARSLDENRLRGVYGLMVAGVLRDPAEAVESVVSAELAPAPAAAKTPAPAAPKADPHAATRQELREEMARSEAMDYVSWLGVSSSVAHAEIVNALETRQVRYEELMAFSADDAQLKTDLEILTGRVVMALRLARRQLEASVAGRPASPKPAAAPAPPPPPPPPPEPTIEVEVEAEDEPEPEPEPAPAPAAAAPAPSASSMEIEHLLLEASIKLSVSDFADAAKTYAKVVKLAPDVAEYHARLAMTMARTSRLARQAEAEFQEAIRLDPDNAELHYQLGLYYKAMKVRSRSVTEFRTAVRLNPRHKKAREELE